jgi:hypothetical protein
VTASLPSSFTLLIMVWDWSQVNWAAEIVKFISTLGGVSIGAYAAYQFANKGRKEDLLIKERYKASETITGSLYNLHFNYLGLTNYGMTEGARSRESRLEDARSFFEFLNEFVDLRKYFVFLSQSLIDELGELYELLNKLKPSVYILIDAIDSKLYDQNGLKGLGYDDVMLDLHRARSKAHVLIAKIIEDQNLPGLKLPNHLAESLERDRQRGRHPGP